MSWILSASDKITQSCIQRTIGLEYPITWSKEKTTADIHIETFTAKLWFINTKPQVTESS